MNFKEEVKKEAEKIERDIAAEFDALKARFEKLVEHLRNPHGIHFE